MPSRASFTRLKRLAAYSILVVLTTPVVAQAEEIDFQRALGLRSTISISGMYNGSVSAGELVWTWIGATPAGFASTFYTYCIDLLNFVHDPQTVDIRSTADYTGGASGGIDRAAWLFNTFASMVHFSGSRTQAAGLQVAIWETLYDGSTDLGTGNFILNTTGSVRTYAGNYLNELARGFTETTATWLDSSSGQDQLTHSLSEPSTLLMLGTAMLIAAGRLRRPRSKERHPVTQEQAAH